MLCIVVIVLAKPTRVPSRVLFDSVCDQSLLSVLKKAELSLLCWSRHPGLIFLELAPPLRALAQASPAASCYPLVLKITPILGETSFIIHGFDLLISPLSQKMTFLLAASQPTLP